MGDTHDYIAFAHTSVSTGAPRLSEEDPVSRTEGGVKGEGGGGVASRARRGRRTGTRQPRPLESYRARMRS